MILVDHFPFSSRDMDREVGVLHQTAKRHLPDVLLSSVFRGFIGSNSVPVMDVAAFEAAREKRILDSLTTQIAFVYIAQPPAREDEVIASLPVLGRFRDRCRFVGFAGPRRQRAAGLLCARTALAHVGGGGERVQRELTFIAGLLRRLWEDGVILSGCLFVGRNTPVELANAAAGLLGPSPVKVRGWSDHLERHGSRAQLYITLGGYNSTMELPNPLATRIVVPRITELGEHSEQLRNAHYWHQRGRIDAIIRCDKVSVEDASRIVAEALQHPRSRPAEEWRVPRLADTLMHDWKLHHSRAREQ